MVARFIKREEFDAGVGGAATATGGPSRQTFKCHEKKNGKGVTVVIQTRLAN